VELVLFEAATRLGGTVGTEFEQGYLIEKGADSFITDKPWAVDLCRRLDLEDRLIPTDARYRGSLVLRRGKPLPVPEGFLLLSPARIWPVLTSPLFSPWGKLRMGLEYFVRAGEADDESLAAFVRRRFGQEVLERLVQPLVGGIYTSDPDKLSLQATLPRFLEMERRERSLIRAARKQAKRQPEVSERESGARYGLFATLQGGLSELVDRLEASIAAQGTLRLQTAVSAIRRATGDSQWELATTNGSLEKFDAVILALRANQAADVLSEQDADLSALLREIEYASSAIVITGFRLSDIRHPLNSFGLVVPAIEKRNILAVSFGSRKFPGRAPAGHVLLRTFVGGAMQPELLEASDDELIAMVCDELRELLEVRGDAELVKIARYTNAMPQYHVGHVARVEQIAKQAGRHAGLALAGNAYDGVGIPDCIRSGEQAAQQVFSAISESAASPR
jgi:oxygen-dependent protoporphyrinogen oxidase